MANQNEAVEEILLELTNILDGEVHSKCDYHETYLELHDLAHRLADLANFKETVTTMAES